MESVAVEFGPVIGPIVNSLIYIKHCCIDPHIVEDCRACKSLTIILNGFFSGLIQ